MFGERVSIGIPRGRSESSSTLRLILIMLHVLAQLFAFTRFPFMSGKVWKTSVSPETSSQNRDVGGYRLRRLMLKMSVSPETSSQNRDVEIAGLMTGSALRLEESRDGRWVPAPVRERFIEWGRSRRGRGSG